MRSVPRLPLAPGRFAVTLATVLLLALATGGPWSLLGDAGTTVASTTQDYKRAPSDAELGSRAEEYILNRRIAAIVLIGGTLIGGALGSVMRRRARRRARELETSHGHPPEED